MAWRRAETIDRPTSDRDGEPVYEPFVELETKRRACKLLGVAHEDAALSEQPQRANDSLLVGRVVRQEAANQFGYGGQEKRRPPRPVFSGDKTPPWRSPR